MRHRNDLILLRIAQGDAYGMASEYCERHPEEPEYAEIREFKRYLGHPAFHTLAPGTYTDDTQMSIAVSEALIEAFIDATYLNIDLGEKIETLSVEHFTDRFFNAFKRDPRNGYSRKFQSILEEAKTPDHLRQLIIPDSTKNGAAMRSVPLGVLKDPTEIVRLAGLQASITHATYEGINSSAAVALMSHYALYDRRGFPSM